MNHALVHGEGSGAFFNSFMMAFEFSLQEERDYLLVIARGDYEPLAIEEAIIQLRDKVQETQCSHVLIDAYDLLPPKENIHRYWVGLAMAEHLPHSLRVAVLSKPERITKFMEKTAVNRGAQVFVCSDKTEALEWLFKEPLKSVQG